MSQEGLRREESEFRMGDGGWGCCLENVERAITRQLKSAPAPTLWKAKQGERLLVGLGLGTRKHPPKHKAKGGWRAHLGKALECASKAIRSL